MLPVKVPISLSPLAHHFHLRNSPSHWMQEATPLLCPIQLPTGPCHLLDPEITEEGIHCPGKGFLPKPHAVLLEALLFPRQLAPQAQQTADA